MIVKLHYTCKNGNIIEMTSNNFATKTEATKWESWLNFLLKNLKDIDSIGNFKTTIENNEFTNQTCQNTKVCTRRTCPCISTIYKNLKPSAPKASKPRRSARLRNKRKQ